MEALIFFAGEDETALRQQFIDYKAKYFRSSFSSLDICEHIFKDLREPLRYIQAAYYWDKDISIQDAIRNKVEFKDNTTAREKRIALLESIAENPHTSARDRIEAIKLIATMEGEIIKAVEKKITYPNGQGPMKGGAFLFTIDPNAGKPRDEVDDDDIEE